MVPAMRTRKDTLGALLLGVLLLIVAGALLAGAQQPPPPQQEPQGPLPPPAQEEAPYALRVDVPIVNVDVTVVDKDGNFVTGLERHHFRVYQDKEEQEIVAFAPSTAPLTTVLLVEANPANYRLLWDNLDAAYLFTRQLRKGDWIALMSYDLKPRLEVDFTQNSQEIVGGLRRLQFPAGFREANMFDAVADTLDRMKDIEGKKSIIVVGTGLNTFSRHTWDDIQKIARDHRTVIYGIGNTWLLQMAYERYELYGHDMSIPRMTLLTAEAQMKALAEQTGGRAYFPRFTSALPGIYSEIGAMLRNQYSLAFRPKDLARDGKYRKIEIELVGPDGQKLKVVNQDGKDVKYKIYAREGYYSPEA